MTNAKLLSLLIPRQAVPPLQVPTLDHSNFTFREDVALDFALEKNFLARGECIGAV